MKHKETESSYDFELERVIQEVRNRKSSRIVLQFPDGLIQYASRIAREIRERTDSETIVSLDTCFGACDLATNAAFRLSADLIVHYGHATWQEEFDTPVIYVEAFSSLEVNRIFPKIDEHLGQAARVGLVSTIQHIRMLDELKGYLEKKGLVVLVGEAAGKVPYDGQVLGCDYSTAKSVSGSVDKFIILGGGRFHLLGLALATKKACIAVDPYAGTVTDATEILQNYLKSRYAQIVEARGGNTFGVVVGLKSGQLDINRALEVAKMLRESRKAVVLFCTDSLSPDRLNSIRDVDAFVITACPRIAIDDAGLFRRPVLTVDESKMLFSDELLEAYLAVG